MSRLEPFLGFTIDFVVSIAMEISCFLYAGLYLDMLCVISYMLDTCAAVVHENLGFSYLRPFSSCVVIYSWGIQSSRTPADSLDCIVDEPSLAAPSHI